MRAAGIERADSAEAKLDKLQTLLVQFEWKPCGGYAAVRSALLNPGRDRYPLPNLMPQRLKERTLGAWPST